MSTVIGILLLAGFTYFLVTQIIGLVKDHNSKKQNKSDISKKEEDK